VIRYLKASGFAIAVCEDGNIVARVYQLLSPSASVSTWNIGCKRFGVAA